RSQTLLLSCKIRASPNRMGTGRMAAVNDEAHFVAGLGSAIVGRMSSLGPVASVDIQILVDNVTDSLSSVPAFVETEMAGLGRRRGAAGVVGGGCLCGAAPGLSCLLTLRSGDSVRTVLFDTGPEDRTFEQNVSRLGVELGPVEAMVLSHGHWDHGGAMLRALDLVRDRNGGRHVPCYMHPG